MWKCENPHFPYNSTLAPIFYYLAAGSFRFRMRRVGSPESEPDLSWNLSFYPSPHRPFIFHISQKTEIGKTGPCSFYLPEPSWAKWSYGPWDHFMFSSKSCPNHVFYHQNSVCLGHTQFLNFLLIELILLVQHEDSPSAESRFSFCRMKILLLQNQDLLIIFQEYNLLFSRIQIIICQEYILLFVKSTSF